MLDQYKIVGPKKKVEVEVEAEVADALVQMEAHTKISSSEITNTALKRFIAGHKDFFPAGPSQKKK
ncbi:hypothetical protein EBS43_05150 [bacterium]|jgi:hypothetical protein|nr:hypothetical protein [bacterium]